MFRLINSIFTILQLLSHADDHMVEVRIKRFTLWNVHAIRRFEMVSSQDIVNVIYTTRPHSNLGEISRPNTSISIFGLVLGEVRRVNSYLINSFITNLNLLSLIYLSLSSHSW